MRRTQRSSIQNLSLYSVFDRCAVLAILAASLAGCVYAPPPEAAAPGAYYAAPCCYAYPAYPAYPYYGYGGPAFAFGYYGGRGGRWR